MEAAELRALVQRKLQDGGFANESLTAVVADGGDELYVVWRKKDVIIVAGKNIHPQDIEEIVSSHPAIHDGRRTIRCPDQRRPAAPLIQRATLAIPYTVF
jgi:acyl-CoA synthetase (AMP-forming)/AMP-acid ligase II